MGHQVGVGLVGSGWVDWFGELGGWKIGRGWGGVERSLENGGCRIATSFSKGQVQPSSTPPSFQPHQPHKTNSPHHAAQSSPHHPTPPNRGRGVMWSGQRPNTFAVWTDDRQRFGILFYMCVAFVCCGCPERMSNPRPIGRHASVICLRFGAHLSVSTRFKRGGASTAEGPFDRRSVSSTHLSCRGEHSRRFVGLTLGRSRASSSSCAVGAAK